MTLDGMAGFPTSPRHTRQSLSNALGAHYLTLLERIDFDPLEHQVMATGSMVEGFGNTGSDIDLYIVGESAERTQQLRWEERWVDLTYLRAEVVHELDAQLPEVDPAIVDWVGLAMPPLKIIDRLHRFAIAVPLTDPLKSRPLRQVNRHRLRRVVAYQNIVTARARWVDAVGAAASAQHDQAWWAATIALGHAVDAYCALLGETNPSPKWRWAKLARLAREGRDPLGLSNVRPSRHLAQPANDVLRLAGSTLFAAQCLFCGRGLPEPRHPDVATERFEVHSTGIIMLRDGVRGDAASVDFSFRRGVE